MWLKIGKVRLAGFMCLLLALAVYYSLGKQVVAGSQPAPVVFSTSIPPQVASQEELDKAIREWSQSAHAETYDQGMGANTTCARCKSPANWDPNAASTGNELNCSSCKRIPGAPRPNLEGGVAVPYTDWKHISCEICHQPVGDSYQKTLSFWDPETLQYEAVSSEMELCGHCHEGRHGFEVIEEQNESPAHNGWECSRCHGNHGSPAKCTDCHDPARGKGALEHARHPGIHCSACHDQGGLSIWKDTFSGSRHENQWITLRFAHTLTSWPSHNLSRNVSCVRCHHPRSSFYGSIASMTPCGACHEEGASFYWCTGFQRDLQPTPAPAQSP